MGVNDRPWLAVGLGAGGPAGELRVTVCYSPRMAIQLDHVALAVEDLEASVRLWVDVLGLEELGRETVVEQGVHVAFLDAGGTRIELLEPIESETAVGRHLSRRGPGIHHLCVRVPDLEAALEELKVQGVPLINDSPQPGAHGTRVAFVHPRGTGGVLLELVEEQS